MYKYKNKSIEINVNLVSKFENMEKVFLCIDVSLLFYMQSCTIHFIDLFIKLINN